jgi:peroxiredoxin Q/BCP
VAVLGASFDTPEDNRAFAEKYAYAGRILSDMDRVAAEAYETARPPDDPSATYAKRRTFVIDPDGVIRKVYAVKDIPEHPSAVLDDLDALGVRPPAG